MTAPLSSNRGAEVARMWHVDRFCGLDLMRATFASHAFPRHVHPTYVVEVVERGADVFECAQREYVAPAGAIIVINPFTVHTGAPVCGAPLSYRSLYPPVALMSELARHAGWGIDGPPRFSVPVIYDRPLAAELTRAHAAFERGLADADCDALLVGALTHLIERHADHARAVHPADGARRAVRRAREYLLDHAERNVPLRTLGRVSGLSPFALARAFRTEIGLPPHEYITSVRIERAKRLLACGRPIVEAAHEAGFCDQSHLTRRFHRYVGCTPGQYVSSKIVQDGGSDAPYA